LNSADYASLPQIVRSLKSTGKGACILPHGVWFRGHAKAEIRRNLIRKGYIKGILGLPPNLSITSTWHLFANRTTTIRGLSWNLLPLA
jgi:type I restriction-modification system DNA methylase subunit